MIIAAITLDDVGDEQWMYCLQYFGRIYRRTSPMPLEAMSVTEQQSTLMEMFAEAMTVQQQEKLNQRPQEAFEEVFEKAIADGIVEPMDPEDEEEDDEDEEEIRSFTDEELWDEINRRREEDTE